MPNLVMLGPVNGHLSPVETASRVYGRIEGQ